MFWKPPEGSERAPREPREPSEGSWESLGGVSGAQQVDPLLPAFCLLGVLGVLGCLGRSLEWALRVSCGGPREPVRGRSWGVRGSEGDLGRSWTVLKT